jgi:hypothetical protein
MGPGRDGRVPAAPRGRVGGTAGQLRAVPYRHPRRPRPRHLVRATSSAPPRPPPRPRHLVRGGLGHGKLLGTLEPEVVVGQAVPSPSTARSLEQLGSPAARSSTPASRTAARSSYSGGRAPGPVAGHRGRRRHDEVARHACPGHSGQTRDTVATGGGSGVVRPVRRPSARPVEAMTCRPPDHSYGPTTGPPVAAVALVVTTRHGRARGSEPGRCPVALSRRVDGAPSRSRTLATRL